MKRSIVLLVVALAFTACRDENAENWLETKEVKITPYKSDPENGKQYLDVIYENASTVNIKKIKVELLKRKGTSTDTVVRIITPQVILKPKDRHLVPRPIGETPADFDEVTTGRVWMIEQK